MEDHAQQQATGLLLSALLHRVSFAHDPDRVTRFEREAKALAALNHAHVAQIYRLEQPPTGSIFVMELIDGEDLAMRIGRGPLTTDDALAARTDRRRLRGAHDTGSRIAISSPRTFEYVSTAR